MSQAAHAERIAPVIDLDEWRFADLSPEERAIVLSRRGQHNPTAYGWANLYGSNQSDTRDAAAIIARLGGHPIAVHGFTRASACTCGRADCPSPGKHPVEAGWQTAALDLARLDEMLRERWELNLGWRMGEQPGGFSLLVIDVDGDRSLLDPLEARLGKLPETLTAKSPRGWHFFYRAEPGRMIRNRAKLAPGVDVRGIGGQVVVAPSKHASGARYQWHVVREPAVLP